ncbi:hypothetical protein UFOVP1290_45 [uncultured Caudovirales phage]|uniref:Uncharacterized protein n=1 Tax=uncultured Caudovirales phage TaxID=2100421 RepID=A0A6J5RWA2_9CAUD|nr:hypothetical protein UFOVP1290_45 [uncultured Caudovirales phage]
MNNTDKIKQICSKYTNICISLDSYIDIIKIHYEFLECITDRNTLSHGYFANILGSKVFVSRIIDPNHFRISCKENLETNSFDVKDWSPEMNLEIDISNIERYLNMIAFW